MSQELFTEVPIEQQETISGGLLNLVPRNASMALGAIVNSGETFFSANQMTSRTLTATNGQQSVTDSETSQTEVNTGGSTFNIVFLNPFSNAMTNGTANGSTNGNGNGNGEGG